MAHSGRSRQRAALGGPARSTKRQSVKTTKQPAKKPEKTPQQRPESAPEPHAFRLGAVPGATPGKWIDTWKQRMPHVTLELVPIEKATQRAAIDDLDAALVRLPLLDESLHLIPLYDEVPVVVASAESHLMSVDRLTADDLVGEVLITPLDDVLGPLDLPTVTPSFPPIDTTADAIATVATGVGIVVVPMSLARLHQRKDVDYRPLLAGPSSTVALAWSRERTNEDIDTFVGIVRGRTANSSR
ncbi:transcriptional regulator [Microbacterium sp. CH12i]|uniref:LysR substrate-binding domain-containing protein n=1 Tax=Microbacterium sp. CH12i TaxID=1479651 RepID=UPI000461EDCE|nr:LysR substrate-binding domain-containing protein [Microbacterium sp. CH12i]KDA07006.1 transcriptional regulator [Microbacterium sp. CH12i]